MKGTRYWLPAGVLAVALAVRATTLALTHFDGLYGQDPFAYWRYTGELRQALLAGQAPPPFFWPFGYPLLAVVAGIFLGPTVQAAQAASLLAGALVAPLVSLLVLAIRPGARAGALVAGLAAAFASQLLLSSLSVMADAAALMWATLSAWLLLRYWQKAGPFWLFLSAVTLALAILTRLVYGLLALPWVLSTLLAWRQAGIPRRQALLAAFLASVGGGLLLWPLLASSRDASLPFLGDFSVVTWNLANAVKRTVVNSDGLFQYRWPMGFFYALPLVHPSYLVPLFTPFLLPGMWSLRRMPAEAVLLLGWPLAGYLFLAGISWQNWRFPLPFFPPLLVLAGLGAGSAWQWLGKRRRPWLLAYAGLGLLIALAWSGRHLGSFTRWKEGQVAVARQAARLLPAESTLLTFGITLTVQQYTGVPAHDLSQLAPAEVAALQAEGHPLYLLLDPDNVTSQWQGKNPEQDFTWLAGHGGLAEVARFGQFVLYRAGGSGEEP